MDNLTTGPVVSSQLPLASAFAEGGGSLGLPELPRGFPLKLNSALAWTGDQFTQTDYVVPLTAKDIHEIEIALEAFKEFGLDGNKISRENFPLPTLGAIFDNLSKEIYSGKGFGLVRGLDVKKYSVEDLTMLYLGIQSHVADRRGRQDKKGNMLVHIIADCSATLKAEHHRHSTDQITFHTEEAGDVVSWLIRGTAAAGGKSVIASANTIYNVLAATRPDIIRTLARSDWPFAMPRFHCRPILYFHDSKLIINFGRTPLIGNALHVRPAHLPGLAARQLEALDAVEQIARATELAVTTQPGDILFINNLAILHRRDSFVNGQSPNYKRHLVRMRLRCSALAWAIPPELKREWADAFDADTEEMWHLEPMPEAFFPLRMYAN